MAHVAGNINTQRIRRFPVVTEVCVQYVLEARISGRPLRQWLRDEWRRTGLPLRLANEACGVRNAATRKYFDQGHLWYYPPPEAMRRLSDYANRRGIPAGRPYFSLNGSTPVSAAEWADMRSRFHCPHGVTNVWDRDAVHGEERVTTGSRGGRAVHLNQKPLDLMGRVILASTHEAEVVWEPFGGLFTASLAARGLGRRAYGAEIDATYYQYGVRRFVSEQLRRPAGCEHAAIESDIVAERACACLPQPAR
jgi:site-specific DNA-methyltransferase (adenine-specific)